MYYENREWLGALGVWLWWCFLAGLVLAAGAGVLFKSVGVTLVLAGGWGLVLAGYWGSKFFAASREDG